MHFANLAGRAVLYNGSRALDLATASDSELSEDPMELFTDFERTCALAKGLEGDWIDAPVEMLSPPVPRPRQVFAIGLNYASHAAETGRPLPEMPATFTKYPTSLTGPSATVGLCGDRVDWEIELVVVMGAVATKTSEGEAWSKVAGLMVGQDLSDRTIQQAAGGQFSLAKSFAGYAPTGPAFVTLDEVVDRDDLHLSCTLNGEVVQDGRTSDLVFSVPALIESLSHIVTLLPGDLIFTGTPAGVGVSRTPPRFLVPGDVLVSTIEGLGSIETRLV